MSGWPMVTLGEVVHINPRLTSIVDPDEEVAFVPMAELNSATGTTSLGTPRPFAEVSKGYTPFKNGDILVAKITPCFENMKIGHARLSRELGMGSTEFHVVRPVEEKLDHRYLLHFLRREEILRRGELRMTGSGGQRRVPAQFLSTLQLQLPPLDEQRRIATILDATARLLEKSKERSSYYSSLIDSVLESCVTAQPKHFLSLGDICDVQGGLQVSSKRNDLPISAPYLRVANVYRSKIHLKEVRRIRVTKAELERVRLHENDILVVEGHGNIDELGRAAIWEAECADMLHQNHLIRVRVRGDEQSPVVLEKLLNSPRSRAYHRRTGVTTSGLNTTSTAKVRNLPVPHLSTTTQQTLEGQIRGIQRQSEATLAHTGSFRAIFAAVQARAFRGEL